MVVIAIVWPRNIKIRTSCSTIFYGIWEEQALLYCSQHTHNTYGCSVGQKLLWNFTFQGLRQTSPWAQGTDVQLTRCFLGYIVVFSQLPSETSEISCTWEQDGVEQCSEQVRGSLPRAAWSAQTMPPAIICLTSTHAKKGISSRTVEKSVSRANISQTQNTAKLWSKSSTEFSICCFYRCIEN